MGCTTWPNGQMGDVWVYSSVFIIGMDNGTCSFQTHHVCVCV